jgi:hypothetical protein
MRTALILLAFVAVLGFVREAGADDGLPPKHDYTISIGGYSFGFLDWEYDIPGRDNELFRPNNARGNVCLGPLGYYKVPFTATQGLVGFCFILATLIVLPIVLTVRWRRRATV